jgi:hypothetical protein
MSAASVTLRGRARAEEQMLDTCSIARVTGLSTDPDTGVVTPTATTVYTGKCKVQQGGVPIGAPTNVGEASVMFTHLQLHVPISATDVRADDVATITAAALDPDLVGRRYTISAPAAKTFLTARRFDVQLVSS